MTVSHRRDPAHQAGQPVTAAAVAECLAQAKALAHDPLKLGTPAAIVTQATEHLRLDRDELTRRPFA